MNPRDEQFLCSLECYFGVYFPRFPPGNKHQNNPLVSAERVRHSSTCIILYLCKVITMALRAGLFWRHIERAISVTIINWLCVGAHVIQIPLLLEKKEKKNPLGIHSVVYIWTFIKICNYIHVFIYIQLDINLQIKAPINHLPFNP